MSREQFVSNCIVCGRKAFKISLCNNCLKSPLNIENLRKYFAEKNDLVNFKETYSRKYSEIHNKNTERFWDKKLSFSIKNYSTTIENFMEKNKIDDVLSVLKNKSGKLLDIGIGLGQVEEKLYRNNKELEIWGIDNSSFAINRIKKKISGHFIKSSVLDFVFKEGSFDVVICLDVLEHISPNKNTFLLDKIYGLLKPSGTLVVTIPLNEGLEELMRSGVNPNQHVRAYYPVVLETELKISHFTILSKKYYIAFKKMYKVKSFICKFLVGIKKSNLMLVVAKKDK